MCLIAFALKASARWPLVLAANRDEFFDRPALALDSWRSASGRLITAGRDLRAGGSWLGLSDNGRIAMLTNVREAASPGGAHSRGDLVTRWLDGDMDAAGLMRQTDPSTYGGFNLVVGDFQKDRWTWISNRSFGLDSQGAVSGRALADGWSFRALGPGVYGLSNAALDTPWPKTVALKQALADALTDRAGYPPDAADLEPPLWTALGSRLRTARGSLPDSGVPSAVEEMLSSAFVDDGAHVYGTRCSTVLLAEARTGSADWSLSLRERTHGPGTPGAAADAAVAQLEWRRSGS